MITGLKLLKNVNYCTGQTAKRDLVQHGQCYEKQSPRLVKVKTIIS